MTARPQLEVMIEEDHVLRHDINSEQIRSTYPCLPRSKTKWDMKIKDRNIYLTKLDSDAYAKLVHEHGIHFRPPSVVKLNLKDKIRIFFERCILLFRETHVYKMIL